MFSDLFLYFANRATKGAVDQVTRRASWGGLAVALLLAGFIFALIVGFWVLEPRLGAIAAGMSVALFCFVVGLFCLAMPSVLDWFERQAKPVAADPVSEGLASVQQEVSEAVDYFGPVRVVASAFALGLGLARQIRN